MMMNLNDLHVEQEIAQERYQKLIRQREIDRLLGRQPSLVQVSLAGLGRQIAKLGRGLETRFDPTPCCA